MIADLLIRIKNAELMRHEYIKAPYSRADLAVAEILAKYNYIESVSKKGRLPKRIMEIKLKYAGKIGAINGIKLLSKSSRRLYAGYQDLRPVKHGHGLGVISTSAGIMSYEEAVKNKVGGEVLFEIW